MMMKNNPDIKFFDTSSLLILGERIQDINEEFLISSITLKELERIKTSANKSEEVKYAARVLTRYLNDSHFARIIIHKVSNESAIANKSLASLTDEVSLG